MGKVIGVSIDSVHSSVLRDFLDANPDVNFIQCMIMDYGSALHVRVATQYFVISLAERNSPLGSPALTVAESETGGI